MNPSIYGQPVTLTASITPANASGIVVFFDGIQTLGTASAPNGQAVLTTLLLHSGNHSLRAVYTGAASYNASASAPLPQTVNSVAVNDFKATAVNTSPTAGGVPVAVSDLNGDGKLDLVTNTGVALGNGDGTFQVFLPTSEAAVAAGDFNGDGKPDLASATGMLLGNGDGTFQPVIAYPPNSGLVGAVGDFNGDGKADLATNTGVLLGNRDGTFRPEAGYPAGSLNSGSSTGSYRALGQGNLVAVGDFNGDGKADVFVVYLWMQGVPGGPVSSGFTGVALLGNGDGTFQPPALQTGSTSASPLAGINILSFDAFLAADFNGDGKDDIVVSTQGSVAVYLSNGDGTFNSGTSYATPSASYRSNLPVTAADFNGDGKLDLAVPGPDNGAVEVLLGNGDGTFQTGVLWAVADAVGFPGAVVAGDFNGDGRVDLLAGPTDQTESLGLLLGSNVAAPPSISTAPLPNATIGDAYSAALTASGGTPPYAHWIVLGGALPAGLALNPATGILSGTPTAINTRSFYVSAEDSFGNLAPERALSIAFNTRPIVTPETLPGGFLSIFYSHQLSATDGAGFGYAWAVASGSLPPGLTLNATSGVISGTPATTAGSPFSFSVTATDVAGVSPPQAFSISIAATGATPEITALAPRSAAAGSPAIVITITGTGFYNGSVASWKSSAGSSPLVTNYIDSTTLTALIPAADLQTAQNALIFVVNPDGQASDDLFTIVSLASPLQLVPVTPCRVLDTRSPNGPLGGPFLAGNTSRQIPVPSSDCGVPANAAAYSLNVTVVPRAGALGFLGVWPYPLGTAGQPPTSTLNSPNGQVLANAAIVAAGAGGSIYAYASNDTDLVVDINGYFVPPSGNTLQFFPLPPCRVLDTRNPAGTFGGPSIAGNTSRSFPIPNGACSAPANATAYSLNLTAVPQGSLSYVTAWPSGQTQPFVSTLNSFDGTTLANAAIVAAGTGGAVSFYATDTTDLVVDINGYFAPPGPGGLNFYPMTPSRVVDTRAPFDGPNAGPALDGGTIRTFPLADACSRCFASPVYSLNVTAVPHGVLGYLATLPTGETPLVSTLNAWKGQIAANAALVQEGTGGSVDVFVSNTTDVVIDLNGYFAP